MVPKCLVHQCKQTRPSWAYFKTFLFAIKMNEPLSRRAIFYSFIYNARLIYYIYHLVTQAERMGRRETQPKMRLRKKLMRTVPMKNFHTKMSFSHHSIGIIGMYYVFLLCIDNKIYNNKLYSLCLLRLRPILIYREHGLRCQGIYVFFLCRWQ